MNEYKEEEIIEKLKIGHMSRAEGNGMLLSLIEKLLYRIKKLENK